MVTLAIAHFQFSYIKYHCTVNVASCARGDPVRGGALGAKTGYTKIGKVRRTQLSLVQSISMTFLRVQKSFCAHIAI